MKPFLRPTDRARLQPVGWTAEPAGIWAGKPVEVVYDPRRHQVVLARNEPGDKTRMMLAGEGYRRLAVDGQQEMWVRDRTSAAEQLQARVVAIQAKATAATIEGRGL